MKFLVALFVLACCNITGYTQRANDYYETDRIALGIPASRTNTTADIAAYINAHFDSDGKKVRAIYTWVATNIRYNADSMRPMVFEEDRELRIASTLRRKKGVCENYASIFNDICLKSGLRSFIIEGYTKQNGFMDKSPHAWCAVYVNNNWLLYDPTWDEGRAFRGLSTGNTDYNYFEVPADVFIQTHMPFDPMFQLLNYPITYKEFYNGNTQINSRKPYFNYTDSISTYEHSNSLVKHLSAASRIQNNGTMTTTMTANKINKLKMDIEIIYQDRDTTLYNSAVSDYNKALSLYNVFIVYRNNRFTPAKTDDEIQASFEEIKNRVTEANLKLQEVNNSKATLTLNTSPLQTVLDDLVLKVKDQQAFLTEYLSTSQRK